MGVESVYDVRVVKKGYEYRIEVKNDKKHGIAITKDKENISAKINKLIEILENNKHN